MCSIASTTPSPTTRTIPLSIKPRRCKKGRDRLKSRPFFMRQISEFQSLCNITAVHNNIVNLDRVPVTPNGFVCQEFRLLHNPFKKTQGQERFAMTDEKYRFTRILTAQSILLIVPASPPCMGCDRKVSSVVCHNKLKPSAKSCARSETGTIKFGCVPSRTERVLKDRRKPCSFKVSDLGRGLTEGLHTSLRSGDWRLARTEGFLW